MYNPVQDNPLASRADLERAAVQLLTPLLHYMSPGCARIHLGNSGAAYAPSVAQVEAFARPLWAIIPLLAGGSELVKPLWAKWREGIIHGTDPAHPEYWGESGNSEQRLVEMAVFGVGLALAPDAFYHDLPAQAQANLYAWLNQINRFEVPQNNWAFFRLLVNMGFICCGLPHDQRRVEEDFQLIEAHYEGDGWYFDSPDQRDYYSIWEFHYDGLIYARAMAARDPQRAARFIERARLMAPRFACWFDAEGEALPYGRSLTYRFAQSAVFSAMAYAGVEAPGVGYGVQKHLLFSNLRSWLRKPIFSSDGVLSVGYAYPNLLMAEGYNAPGSPYWGMKAFLCLALPEEHPFWQAKEQPFAAPSVSLQPHARLLFSRSGCGRHVMAFAAGNHAAGHSLGEAKYEKFVYSTRFGFSVPKGRYGLAAGAFDSMLAVSEDGLSWFVRFGCDSFELSEECVRFSWSPCAGVRIQTRLIPQGEWHLRVHEVTTDRAIEVAEGGYAIARGERGEATERAEGRLASLQAPWGSSCIQAIQGFEHAELVIPEPNTNLLAQRTAIPTLRAGLQPGSHRLVCAVLGAVDPAAGLELPEALTEVL